MQDCVWFFCCSNHIRDLCLYKFYYCCCYLLCVFVWGVLMMLNLYFISSKLWTSFFCPNFQKGYIVVPFDLVALCKITWSVQDVLVKKGLTRNLMFKDMWKLIWWIKDTCGTICSSMCATFGSCSRQWWMLFLAYFFGCVSIKIVVIF